MPNQANTARLSSVWSSSVKRVFVHCPGPWSRCVRHLSYLGPTLLKELVISPCWVSEGDVILLGPACKHLFLCDEAMVGALPTPLILQVGHTLICASGFIVVVRHLLGLGLFSGKRGFTNDYVDNQHTLGSNNPTAPS